jgi:hypothetical protein
MSRIKVSDAIRGLREELSAAMDAATDERLRFQVKGLSLELTALVEWEAKGKTKANWFVFGGEGGVKRGDVTTQTLKIELEVVTDDGRGFVMSRSKE